MYLGDMKFYFAIFQDAHSKLNLAGSSLCGRKVGLHNRRGSLFKISMSKTVTTFSIQVSILVITSGVKAMKWIRIWTHRTLFGSTFQELNAEERGIWFSLLVLAGLEPNEGIVEMRSGIPWTLRGLAEYINCPPRRLAPILKKLKSVQINKIEYLPDGRIKIVKWEQYQTEYERYRKGKSNNSRRENPGHTSKEITTAKTLDRHPRQRQKQIKDVDKRGLPPSPPSREPSKNQKGNKGIVDKSVDNSEAVWLKRLEDIQRRTWGTTLINERGLGVLLDGEGKAPGFGDPRLLWLAIARTKTVPRIPMRYLQVKAKDQDAMHRLRKMADNMTDKDFEK